MKGENLGRILLSLPYARKIGTVWFTALAQAYRRILALRGGPVDVLSERDGIRFRLDISEWVQMRIFFDRFIPTYDVDELEFAKRALREGDVAVDVGAQIGLYTLTFSKAVGKNGRVISFEPDPRSRERLAANLALNELASNVTLLPLALSDQPGEATFYRSSNLGHNSMQSGTALETRIDEIRVQTTTVDEFCRRESIERIRLAKIDVEGHETAVLSGARETLARGAIDFIMMEYVAERAAELSTEGFGDAPLLAAGYRRILPDLPRERWPKVANLVYAAPGVTLGPTDR